MLCLDVDQVIKLYYFVCFVVLSFDGFFSDLFSKVSLISPRDKVESSLFKRKIRVTIMSLIVDADLKSSESSTISQELKRLGFVEIIVKNIILFAVCLGFLKGI